MGQGQLQSRGDLDSAKLELMAHPAFAGCYVQHEMQLPRGVRQETHPELPAAIPSAPSGTGDGSPFSHIFLPFRVQAEKQDRKASSGVAFCCL